MEKGFLDKVEDNAAVQAWSEMTQHEKGDSLAEGYISELWDFTRISVTQNSSQELKEIWGQWNDEVRQLFYSNYVDLPYLLDMKVDKRLFRALIQFWNPAYSCFTFEKVNLVPTVEKYMALLRCSKFQVDRIYSRSVNIPTFFKKRLMNITGMSELWVTAQIQQKGDSKCIPWKNLKDIILAHPNTKKRVDVFTLSIYGLVVFPKALGHIDEAVTNLFDRLDKRVTPVPTILAETFRSLNACQRAGEGRFIGCVQLLLAWFHSHFWKVDKVSYRVFSENYSPLKDIITTPRRDDISEEKWMAILQNLQEEDIEWRALWLLPDEILYLRDMSMQLEKKIEQMEEEKMNLRLDADVQKLEVEILRKGKTKAEEDLDGLKIDYKKLRLSMRTVGLGKTSEQWRQEIQEEKNKADIWERKF
ncbi:hypothetical protein Gogos_021185 [Gossypium gossypioides]|uniref:DUF7745 domain-containing protein n=1 Tax=Gossypium gossypioides TaxID=34282 RepID=A0A7J9D3M5_GOSGO|nr:hypothetical protein [Gossypium gossypioides]